MHHIYKTEAIVLSSRSVGESGKYLFLFSKEYGFLKVEANGIRKKESLLRQSVQDYSISEIFFVRGKKGNKLVNAVFISNFFYDISNIKKLKIVSSVFSLVQKMIPEEHEDSYIYSLLLDFKNILEKNIEEEDFLKSVEIIFVYKMLAHLGYIPENKKYDFINSENFNISLIEKFKNILDLEKGAMIKIINNAINESHL